MMTTTQWMDVISNNLANSSTQGYKADTLAFSDVMVQNLYGNGGSGGFIGSIGSGPNGVSNAIDHTVGGIKSTGNPLDVAIRTERGMFAIQREGQTLYTRDGSFIVDNNKTLVNSRGLAVLDDQGKKITINGTGKVEIDQLGNVHEGNDIIGKIAVYDGDFAKAGDNLWTAQTRKPTIIQTPELVAGALEGSNVEPVAAMVELIKVQRSFEMTQKSIQSQDDMTGKLFELLNRR